MKTVRWRKPWLRVLLEMAVIFALPLAAFGQNARLQLGNLEKLNNKAAEAHTVTLEADMLQLAIKFIEMDHDPEAAQLKEVIKDLKGIYVKNFLFDRPNQYSQADVEAIRAQLAAPGWSKIVENRSKNARENSEIYIMKDGNKIAGVAILVAEPEELTVVNIVGPLDLDKLSALEGKFGIPSSEKERNKKPSPEAPREKN
ncbi:MAG TPA: DUF4252 domain-containing protein [Candidatus Angelobacter sp.]